MTGGEALGLSQKAVWVFPKNTVILMQSEGLISKMLKHLSQKDVPVAKSSGELKNRKTASYFQKFVILRIQSGHVWSLQKEHVTPPFVMDKSYEL